MTALLSLLPRPTSSHTPHSVHIAIHIKTCQRRDWETGLWARYSSELGRGNENEFLSSRSGFSMFIAEGAVSDKEQEAGALPAARGGGSTEVSWGGPWVLTFFLRPPEVLDPAPHPHGCLLLSRALGFQPRWSHLGQK